MSKKPSIIESYDFHTIVNGTVSFGREPFRIPPKRYWHNVPIDELFRFLLPKKTTASFDHVICERFNERALECYIERRAAAGYVVKNHQEILKELRHMNKNRPNLFDFSP